MLHLIIHHRVGIVVEEILKLMLIIKHRYKKKLVNTLTTTSIIKVLQPIMYATIDSRNQLILRSKQDFVNMYENYLYEKEDKKGKRSRFHSLQNG